MRVRSLFAIWCNPALCRSVLLGSVALASLPALSCGSAPSSDGLFNNRGRVGGDGAAGSGGATSLGGAAGAGSDVSLPSEFGGTGGQAGGGAEPQASELDGGVPDASTGDAGQADAGDGQLLGCSTADRANCDALVAALVHRYSFEGTGTTVADSVGSAAGSIVNGQLAGTGALALSGSDDFVDLPNGIVSQLSSGTFEVWLNWAGGERWQRAFDMGSSDAAEGTPGVGVDYLFLTPRALDDTVRVTFLSSETNGEVQINTSAPLASGSEQHLAVVVDAQGASLALYVDGALAGSAPLSSSLAAIHDVNNWLGRSQFTSDAPFEGSLLEFRIYGAALSAEQIALSFDLGPDAPVSP